MESFKWMKSLETGNAVIDGQHRELLACLDEMTTLMSEGKGDEAHARCQKLRDLLDPHCADEDGILEDAGFPRLKQHLATHEQAKARIAGVCAACGAACKDNRADPCIADLTFALIDHFLQGDLDFKSFLQVKGLASENG